ncbi:unnamed protein product [Clavelina lepadiformis]|uniref:Uncharacterized protein n=1 Tax=Clavelina lepadiformis TaxID=159417 RepID=A0ABP0FX46_CLALP
MPNLNVCAMVNHIRTSIPHAILQYSTVYKGKKTKIVYLLSLMHKSVHIDEEHRKKLPETVKYYNYSNASKVGVDILDQCKGISHVKVVHGDGLWQCFSMSLI